MRGNALLASGTRGHAERRDMASRVPTRKSDKKSKLEYTVHEAIAMMGFDVNDVDGSRKRLHDLLKLHDATGIGRCVNTVHGPTYYYDKRGMEELKQICLINKERREIESERRYARHLFDNLPVADDVNWQQDDEVSEIGEL